MLGLSILTRKITIRINEPKCKGVIYGCDPKDLHSLMQILNNFVKYYHV